MRKIARLILLSLLLLPGLAACDGADRSVQPTTAVPASSISSTTPTTASLATSASSITSGTQPVTTATPTVGLPVIEAELGPLPTNCPVSQFAYKELSKKFAPGTAGPGLWAVGLQSNFQINNDQLAQQNIKKYGWAIKVLWVIEPEQTEPVTLTAYNRADNQPVWFFMNKETTTPVFPANSSIAGYEEHPSNLFFAKAGCYDLVAKWSGGGWKVTVAVGRQ